MAAISLFAVFSLARLMNVKEDQGQLSAIARYSIFFSVFSGTTINMCIKDSFGISGLCSI